MKLGLLKGPEVKRSMVECQLREDEVDFEFGKPFLISEKIGVHITPPSPNLAKPAHLKAATLREKIIGAKAVVVQKPFSEAAKDFGGSEVYSLKIGKKEGGWNKQQFSLVLLDRKLGIAKD